MNPTLTNFHNRRFEWALQAEKEFLERFAGKTESPAIMEEISQNHEVNELSINRLTKLYKEAEVASKLELAQYEEKMKQQDELIKRHQFLQGQELEEAEAQEKQICNEIDAYEGFLKKNELKNMDPDHIRELVNDIIGYTPDHRKASIINGDVERLQENVARELENKFRKAKQEAGMLKIEISHLLELPYLPPIPKIEQKIDAFWLKSTYEKAIFEIRSIAYDWVTEMYQNYNLLLAPILKEASGLKEQFFQEAEALKLGNSEKKAKLEEELANYQGQKVELDACYQKVYQVWNQDREHIAQLQGYLIKYWLEYKEELQQHFRYGNAEERWLAGQYLQLLRQDGEEIIEALHE
ncbi:hypothetical protein BABA_11716 [Neobacillus bataviensis LMG 21833]|uniref:Uncharacterized protein n=1 Tax=Neobacillus bataviensis LMG 21833 TaxID=1117379 RepID=K6CDA1_9BACI|nr:hypothetical protein [Neobacillus bataviensis]EKN69095.1 hypothetical protein BABA_11716 [Neobacillus bataviensis LMG 21833]